MTDLIARLRATPPAGDFAGIPPVAAQRISDMLQDRTEAAAALEALRAENERLRAIIGKLTAKAEHITFDVMLPPGEPPAEFTTLRCRTSEYDEARAAITPR